IFHGSARQLRVSAETFDDLNHGRARLEPLEHLLASAWPLVRASERAVDALTGADRRAGACSEGASQQLSCDDATDDSVPAEVQIRLWRIVAGDAFGVREVVVVVGAISHQGQRVGEDLARASGTTDTLLVVEPLRWDVGHHHGPKGTDVDADLHRG